MPINHVKDARIKIFEFKKSDKLYEPYNGILSVRKLASGCNSIQGCPANDWDD